MKKFFKNLNSNRFWLILSILLSIGVLATGIIFLGIYTSYVYLGFQALGLLVVLSFLRNNEESPTYKISWLVLIVILPFFGVALYLQLKSRSGNRRARKRWQNIVCESNKYIEQSPTVMENLERANESASNTSKFILTCENMPVFQNTATQYIGSGEKFFEEFFKDIKSAKKYIFLEYFIIKPGVIWSELFDTLRMKAREGVEIKLLYDDFGCMDRFEDKKFFKKLIHHGIEAIPFNKIRPSMNLFMNYRDHRKLCVIDGVVAYSGGINIADEYANIKKPFGYWKDTAIKLIGDAAWNQAVMFLNNWQMSTKKMLDVSRYKTSMEEKPKVKDYVQPYGTGPIDRDAVARNIYMKMLTNARKKVYITTPYFIIDQELCNVIKLASLSGVDVRILLPGIPDKRFVYYLSRSYYRQLIQAGVKIYEYTPGFLHAKMIVSDDSAIIGTTNLDFRSLFLHYENGVLVHNSKTVKDVYADLDAIMQVSHLVSIRDIKHRKIYEKVIASILKFFAPML